MMFDKKLKKKTKLKGNTFIYLRDSSRFLYLNLTLLMGSFCKYFHF